ncbi:MAG: membrane protein insertase YidC [Bacteroidia bacterium]|nr:membrane protein insertase YidC [Bacteroidia bacterium]
MDKRSIFGLVLIFLIVIGFSYLMRPSEGELAAMRAKQDSVARAESARDSALGEHLRRHTQDSTDAEEPAALYDSVWGREQEEQITVLENNLLRLELTTHGGQISTVQIKGYKTYGGDSLLFISPGDSRMGYEFNAGHHDVHTADLNFTRVEATGPSVVSTVDQVGVVTYRYYTAANAWIEYRYSLGYDSHKVQFSATFHNVDNYIQPQRGYIDLSWAMRSRQQERTKEKEREYTTVAYALTNNDFEELNARKSDPQEEKVKTSLSWVGFKQQFFVGFAVREQGFEEAVLHMQNNEEPGYVRDFSARLMFPLSGTNDHQMDMSFYFSPTSYKTLRSYGKGFEQVVPLGGWLVSWVNKYVVINVFDWLSSFIKNYGIIIFLLTLFIKIVVFPLTYKTYLNQAYMRVLKPKIDEINAKYPKKEDALKKQQATMALYKRAGINPMGGCLPLLIQMPILIAMFRFFPGSIELRQKSFLWADDLSSYDSILDLPFSIPFYGAHVSLFTLLMGVSMLVYGMMSYKQTANTSQQMPGMKFMTVYMMPLMMVMWFNNYSSGLSYYYLLTNLITIVQMVVIRRMIDGQKVLRRLEANSDKKVKKNGFMERLERLQREQQKKLDQQRRAGNKGRS